MYECVKIATLLFLLVYSLLFAHPPFSWAGLHPTVCLDICQKYLKAIVQLKYNDRGMKIFRQAFQINAFTGL